MDDRAKVIEEARACGREWASQAASGEPMPEWNGLTVYDFAAISTAVGGRLLTDEEYAATEDAAAEAYHAAAQDHPAVDWRAVATDTTLGHVLAERVADEVAEMFAEVDTDPSDADPEQPDPIDKPWATGDPLPF